MEKDLFPLRQSDLSPADLPPSLFSPRMEGMPEGQGGCAEDPTDSGRGCWGHEGCGADSWGLGEYPPAMVYAPCQTFRGLYDPETALSRGTLFTELDLPLGKEGCGLTVSARPCRDERRRV